MLSIDQAVSCFEAGSCAAEFEMLYGKGTAKAQATRYTKLARRFAEIFPDQTGARFFSAPGRSEIGGNHTDHQRGRVLAAAITLDTLAAAAPNGLEIVRMHSEGFEPVTVNLNDLEPCEEEKDKTAALIRGCAARMDELGYQVGGFDAAVFSDVLAGSGLSSSAAVEVLICTIFDGLFGRGDMPPVLRAKVSQYAENHFFGKPCGLMDQTASSVGGIAAIDFREDEPEVQAIPFDFAARGYAVAVVNTGGSHGDLTDAYASIRSEMEQVAAFLGEKQLRFVEPARFETEIPVLRGKVSDRALLRAFHFFDEDLRVPEQVAALKQGDLTRFFTLVIESGESSWKLLQNVWAYPEEQPLSVALELSRRLLAGQGAWRVHGGGFAGTILAFVPLGLLETYRARMDSVFGQGACRPLGIRPVGAYELFSGKGEHGCC